ncbi:cyclase family protein [Putridiphycobacter roseus]|uniref:Cyclase family protein n=1 Tax=Putridiphycobacter roseus TaxID=2219161 RepID=A0A2W1N0Y3_9FLAO|nr:cyclase family protein [Putridiphycobacter roseus]PZE18259.1 cyclase family protein [Putridiphycobacter roseus]
MILKTTNNQKFDTKNGIDISLPLSPTSGALAWYVAPVKIWPVTGDGFIGKVTEGGSTNFNNILLNPHGNGTHTENVGHISREFYSINESLTQFFYHALLITVQPESFKNTDFGENDWIITKELLANQIGDQKNFEAIIIRTLPNEVVKKNKNYSNTNPPYLTKDAIEYINALNILHLLIDLPSVDRENDNGKLMAHHTFWNYPDQPRLDKTITELIYVPIEVKDGPYILNLQIISLENDASPSKPILYPIES